MRRTDFVFGRFGPAKNQNQRWKLCENFMLDLNANARGNLENIFLCRLTHGPLLSFCHRYFMLTLSRPGIWVRNFHCTNTEIFSISFCAKSVSNLVNSPTALLGRVLKFKLPNEWKLFIISLFTFLQEHALISCRMFYNFIHCWGMFAHKI